MPQTTSVFSVAPLRAVILSAARPRDCQDARMALGRSVVFRVATSKRLERAVKRAPGGEQAAWRSASRYVASRSLGGAIAAVEMLLERGHGVSIDSFGEGVSDPAVADEVLQD